MKSTSLHRVAALTMAAASGLAGCGSEEMFEQELGDKERLLSETAAARLHASVRMMRNTVTVGDLDNDGSDDAVVFTYGWIREDGRFEASTHFHILYGGKAAAGDVDVAELPQLTYPYESAWVVPVGDLDGDGNADVLIGAGRWSVADCTLPQRAPYPAYPGVYVLYGSTQRITGVTPVSDVAAFIRDTEKCETAERPSALGDIDGDGYADFGIGSRNLSSHALFIYHGGPARLSGNIDLERTADAIIRAPSNPRPDPTRGYEPNMSAFGVGDTDGDGRDDFVLQSWLSPTDVHTHLVYGAATRRAGVLAIADVATSEFAINQTCLKDPVALGDLDRDGLDDFAFPECELRTAPNVTDYIENVHLLYGRRERFGAQVSANDYDASFSEEIRTIAAADLNGDGHRDLIAGHSNARDSKGEAHVLFGTGARWSGAITRNDYAVSYVGKSFRTNTWCEDQQPSCIVDENVASNLSIGDLTGDGIADVLIDADSFVLGLPPPTITNWPTQAFVLSVAADPTSR